MFSIIKYPSLHESCFHGSTVTCRHISSTHDGTIYIVEARPHLWLPLAIGRLQGLVYTFATTIEKKSNTKAKHVAKLNHLDVSFDLPIRNSFIPKPDLMFPRASKMFDKLVSENLSCNALLGHESRCRFF